MTLNKTSSPTPAPTNKPPIIVPKLIAPSKKSSVISTLAAQLGISPTIPLITGPTNVFEKMDFEIDSSPKYSITKPSAIDITNKKIKIHRAA